MVIGGQAAFVHGKSRASRDIGFALGVGPEHIDVLCAVMDEVGLTSLAESPNQYSRENYVLPCLHRESSVRVGFIFSLTGYEARAITHAIPRKVGDSMVLFAAPEDLIIEKVFAGGSQDLADAKAILSRHEDLKIDYVRETLMELERELGLVLMDRFETLTGDSPNTDTSSKSL